MQPFHNSISRFGKEGGILFFIFFLFPFSFFIFSFLPHIK